MVEREASTTSSLLCGLGIGVMDEMQEGIGVAFPCAFANVPMAQGL